MASRDSLEMRKLAAQGTVVVSRDDTPVALRIRHLTSEAVTSVVVTAATSIVFTGATNTDTFLFATYTTLGSLIAAINATGRWEAVCLDALLTDSTASSNLLGQTITAGVDGNGVQVWDVNPDTSVFKAITATLSLHRNFDVIGKGHVVSLQEIVYNVDVNAAAANSVRVYQRTKSGVETQLLGIASVDVTKTTVNWAAGVGSIDGGDDCALIVRIQDATSVTDSANNFVQITGILK